MTSALPVNMRHRILPQDGFAADYGPCWIWTGGTNSKGYGCIAYEGRTKSAHRVAYEALRGAIPAGLTIDHLCRNRLCCNPMHMEPVTAAENLRRGAAARNPASMRPPVDPSAGDEFLRFLDGVS